MTSTITTPRPSSRSPTLRSRPQIHTTGPPTRRTSGPTSHPPLTRRLDRQFLRNSREQLLDVLGGLGARLEEKQIGFFGVGFGVGGGDGALIRVGGHEVQFVPCQRDDDVFVCLALELFDPGFCFVEGALYKYTRVS